jgi:hypothetical protein
MDSTQRRTAWQAAGLVVVGAVAGGVLATQVAASASSGTPTATTAAYGEAPGAAPFAPGPHRGFGLPQSGTVTAVGSNSVTIQTSNGTHTYAVDGRSDIDKNGEAALKDLVKGDKVRFALRPGTSTIAVLHAGDEAKDAPGMGPGRGPGGHGPCPNMGGAKPSATPSSGT